MLIAFRSIIERIAKCVRELNLRSRLPSQGTSALRLIWLRWASLCLVSLRLLLVLINIFSLARLFVYQSQTVNKAASSDEWNGWGRWTSTLASHSGNDFRVMNWRKQAKGLGRGKKRLIKSEESRSGMEILRLASCASSFDSSSGTCGLETLISMFPFPPWEPF